MGFLSPKMPTPPAPPPIPETPTVSEEEKAKIAADQAAIERKRKGRSSTILTGPLGLETDATTEKKTLLGG
tara:strand:+ start:16 stop:228 length:213 start_codon:yes stop_codon:yes gene_type:complete